jgi:hypothetical protein
MQRGNYADELKEIEYKSNVTHQDTVSIGTVVNL